MFACNEKLLQREEVFYNYAAESIIQFCLFLLLCNISILQKYPQKS